MPNTCKSSGSAEQSGGERRTGEEYIGICPFVGDNSGKLELLPHDVERPKLGTVKGLAQEDEPMSD